MQSTKNLWVPKKYFFTILFISWVVFITSLSLFSFEDDSLPSINIPHLDKLVHFSFYFVFTVLGCLSFREIDRKNTPPKKVILKIIFYAVVYGIIIEMLQGVATVDREPDLLDVLANSLGALFGSFAVKFIFSGKTPL
ncbi:VanZ family protein [Arenibacter sp. M-2]|uniref:VanZ family protein n=1 Tax=unclassified Arenibacter TaxID=2615047 RepID=UPI000D7620E2|nr:MULTISPECIES: VanZ family protein [unclassified Arenibacter]MDL5513882.1 VanZ family protein [Arenibacter sp. M-2]PXX28887.1 VanZ like protein [Arenibacter sp. ARW7G5Y1]